MSKAEVAWNEALENEMFSPMEIEENNMQAKLICELIEARQAQGYSQRELEALTGVKQSAIARMEKGTSSPTLDTLFKLLVPLGKTLAIVPIQKETVQ